MKMFKTTKKISTFFVTVLLLALIVFSTSGCSMLLGDSTDSTGGTQQGEPSGENQDSNKNNETSDEEETVGLEAGLYKTGSDELTYSWDDLLANKLITVADTTITKVNDKLKGDIRIPDEITRIKASAFHSCSGLSGVYIGPNVVEIGDSAFFECTGIKNLTIEGSVTKIGTKAFYSCTGLGSVVIGDGVTSIEASAFSGCTNLKYLVISDSVTSIGNNAFSGCTGIKLAYIGKNVTYIGDSAFKNCTALEKVFIPAKVSYIGASAFYNCNVLEDVTYEGTTYLFNRITTGKSNVCLTDNEIGFSTPAKEALESALAEIDKLNNPQPEEDSKGEDEQPDSEQTGDAQPEGDQSKGDQAAGSEDNESNAESGDGALEQ